MFYLHLFGRIGHPQPPTPLKTDNTSANSIANDTVKQKCSKAIDMHSIGYVTICDRNSFMYTGEKVVSIVETTTPNIILHNITKRCNQS
jgi:hypothetical protein